MNRPSAGWIVCLLLCGMLIAGVFYLIGYKAAYDRMENTVPSTVEDQLHTETAHISHILLLQEIHILWILRC